MMKKHECIIFEVKVKEMLGADYKIPINPSKNAYEIFKILESKLSNDD